MTQNIHIEEYDYLLPEEKIAKYPLSRRDSSKLLVYKNARITECVFSQINELLPKNSLLVFNNTKVIQARLIFQKETGAQIEIFCLEPKSPSDYAQIFVQNKECAWLCLIGNAKRWKEGILKKQIPGDVNLELCAEKLESYGDTHLVRFFWNNPEVSFAEILELCGELPIPPYLNRKTEDQDNETYQTVYSKIKGSVAAPTAGLHFTKEVFDSLRLKNSDIDELTLHVGAGTFKPVKSETIAGHIMHAECFSIKKATIEQLLSKQGKIIAVGTTSVRSLESLYYIGALLEKNPDISIREDLKVGQWMPYDDSSNHISVEKSLNNILHYLKRNQLQALTAYTQIIIAPGYVFKLVNGIVTNFHQPKSTLLLLISAFLEGNWKSVYDYALAHDFRFLSYGDSSLLLK